MIGAALDRAAIAARVPHAGAMCLLDRVVRWDARTIECRATSHRDAANPLRAAGRLAAVHAIEYAAQAMALHGALLADHAHSAASRPGYIGAVREVQLRVARLDDLAVDLDIRAQHLLGDGPHVVYAFAVRAGEQDVADGRISAALGAAQTAQASGGS